jgi:hypothetical protein
VIVYRLERNGLGPYKWENYRQDEIEGYYQKIHLNHADSQHPSPYEDDLLEVRSDKSYLFGFDCLANLHDWFGDWVNKLAEIGFEIKEYYTEEYKYGNSLRQLIFKPSK